MRKLGAGVAGGMLAGALVGAVEAVVAWRVREGGMGPPALGWAVVVYALVGSLGGAMAGGVALATRIGAFGLGFGGVIAGLGYLAVRVRMGCELCAGAVPHGLAAILAQVAAPVGIVAAGASLGWIFRAADERRSMLTRPGAVAMLVAVAATLGALVRGTGAIDASAPQAIGSPAPQGAPNVVLIVVDALRADHLGCYGHTVARTPHIDALAAAGTRYARAFAQASATPASIATIISGLAPSTHGVARSGDVLPDGAQTLAEVLANGGYHPVEFPNAADVSPVLGFGQGFAEHHYLASTRAFFADERAAELGLYSALLRARERVIPHAVDVTVHYRPGGEVVDRVLGWFDGASGKRRPFYLYLHFMDPHEPYMVHPFVGVGYGTGTSGGASADMAETLRVAYDGEISYLDEQLGRLVDDLRRRGLYDDTLIVLTADHGEEFDEHGGWGHGATLYDEQLWVPLIVKPPRGGASGRVVDAMVTSLDVAPTIIRATGGTPPAAMEGNALPLDGSAVPMRESVFAEACGEGRVLRSVRTAAWKLVATSTDPPRGRSTLELYDLAGDPKETTNRAATEATQREVMRAALGRRMLEARARTQVRTAPATDVDAATQQRLKALGYVD